MDRAGAGRDGPDDGRVAEGVVGVGTPVAAVPERVERRREPVERDEAETLRSQSSIADVHYSQGPAKPQP